MYLPQNKTLSTLLSIPSYLTATNESIDYHKQKFLSF